MAVSEAQKRAKKKYEAENMTKVLLLLNKRTESDIIEALDTCGNKSGYIKRLIREDIAKKQGRE